MIDFDDYFFGADDDFQARMDTAFKKRHGWAARWEGLDLHLSYTKVQTRLNKLKIEKLKN